MGKNSKSRADNLIIYLWLTTARNFSHISLSYFPSEWFRTSLFFAVCDVLGLCIYIKKRKGCISLLNLIGNHETCYPYITALMFGWMAVRLDWWEMALLTENQSTSTWIFNSLLVNGALMCQNLTRQMIPQG